MQRKHRGHLPAPAGMMLVLTLCTPAAWADQEARGFFSVGASFVSPDHNRAADHGIGGTAAYNWQLAPWLWAGPRVFAAVLDSSVGGAPNASLAGASLEVLVPLGSPAGAHLALVGSAGGAHNNARPDTQDGVGTWFDAGLAWRAATSPGDGLRPRIEVRVTKDAWNDGQVDLWSSLVIEFMSPRPAAPAIAAPAPPIRSVVPLQRATPVEPPPRLLAPPRDGDGDGVPDERDQCPETIAGATVERDGCVWGEQVITLSDFRFELDSATLGPASRERLQDVARFFLNQPEVRVDIYGHTDDTGDEAYNQVLSETRAASVRAYLISQGISADRLSSGGFGEGRPVASNETEEGRARNRRVELHIHARQP